MHMMPMGEMKPPHALDTPPYYAVFMKMFQENAIGGMTIDENTNVLKEGKPISGLYAVGDNTRGIMLSGDVGVNFIESVVSAMTFAMNSGYLSAEKACEYCDKV
jgi:predicted oxidoreductase